MLKLLNYFEHQGRFYILLELMKFNLFDYLHKNALNAGQIYAIFYQVCLAIKYLHDQSLIHRDIKPENILLNDQHNVKLCDFDFCAPCNRREYRTTVCGTREYLPPEVIRGQVQTNKVDIWCLGILLFEMFHNQVPFQVQYDSPDYGLNDSRQIPFKQGLDEQAKNLIASCLKVNPSSRPGIDQILESPVFSPLKQTT